MAYNSITPAGTNGAITGGSITVNTSGVSINLPAYLTTAALSQDSSKYAFTGFTSTTGAGANIAGTHDTNGLKLAVPAYLTTAALSGDTSKYNQAWEITGNTAGTTSSLQGTKLYFEGGNSLTVSGNSNTIKFSVGNYLTTAALSQDSSKYAGTNGAITGGSITVNTSGVSVNLPAYITTADLSQNSSKYNQAWELTGNTAGTTSSLQGTKIYFEGGNSITVSGNSNTIKLSVGNYLTTAALSQDSSKYAGTNGAITGGSITVNTSGVSVNLPAYITTADLSQNSSKYMQAWELTGNTAGTTSSAQGTKIYFEGGNKITVSGNSNTIKLSIGDYLTTAMASNRGSDFVQATAAFAGTNASGTIASNGISVSVAAPGAAAENNWVSLLGNNTAGNVTASGSTVGYSGLNLTLSGTNNSQVVISAPATSSLVQAGDVSISTSGSTITISGIQPNVDFYEPRLLTNTSAFVPGAGTWYFAPFVAPGVIAGGRINNLVVNTSTAGIAQEVTSVSFVSGTTGTKNQWYTHSFWNALYSQGTGTNSTRLESFWSNTFSFGLTNTVNVSNVNANSVAANDAWTISYIQDIGSDGAYTVSSYTNSLASTGTSTRLPRADFSTVASSIRAMLSNSVIWPIGFNTTITQGAYWLAQMYSSTSASSVTNYGAASALIFSNLNQVYIQGIGGMESYRNWGSTATTARSNIFLGSGMAYTATSAAPPQYVAISSDLSTVGGNAVPYFNFYNQGLTK